MATIIGQEALVELLISKGLITAEELTQQIRNAKERIAKQIQEDRKPDVASP